MSLTVPKKSKEETEKEHKKKKCKKTQRKSPTISQTRNYLNGMSLGSP